MFNCTYHKTTSFCDRSDYIYCHKVIFFQVGYELAPYLLNYFQTHLPEVLNHIYKLEYTSFIDILISHACMHVYRRLPTGGDSLRSANVGPCCKPICYCILDYRHFFWRCFFLRVKSYGTPQSFALFQTGHLESKILHT